jgi:hypothetical protein
MVEFRCKVRILFEIIEKCLNVIGVDKGLFVIKRLSSYHAEKSNLFARDDRGCIWTWTAMVRGCFKSGKTRTEDTKAAPVVDQVQHRKLAKLPNELAILTVIYYNCFGTPSDASPWELNVQQCPKLLLINKCFHRAEYGH